MTCTTAFSIDDANVSEENNFVYTDNVLQTFSETDNISYTLQAASRYVHDIHQCYARTTSITFSG